MIGQSGMSAVTSLYLMKQMNEELKEHLRQGYIEADANFLLLSEQAQDMLVMSQMWMRGAEMLELTVEEMIPLLKKRHDKYSRETAEEVTIFMMRRGR